MEKREEKIKIEFVIDTNILISALIPKNSKLRDILLSGEFHIYAPEYLLKELDKYWDLILEKAEKRGVLRSNIQLTKEEFLSKIILFSRNGLKMPDNKKTQEFLQKLAPCIERSFMVCIACVEGGAVQVAGI